MKGAKTTLFFALAVAAIGGLAIYEYKKEHRESESKYTQRHFYSGLSAEDVQSLVYKSSEAQYELKKESDEWSLVSPVEDRAETTAVESILRSFMTQNVESVDAGGADINWDQYGLNEPIGEFSFRMNDGSEQGFLIGKVRTYDQGFYLRKKNDPHLYVSAKAMESVLSKGAEDFRSRSIVFPQGEVVELKLKSRVSQKPQELTFQNESEQWTYTQDRQIKIENVSVRDFVNLARNFKGDSILSEEKTQQTLKKYGLSNPAYELNFTVVGSDGERSQVEVAFGWINKDDAAMRASGNKPLYKVPRGRVEGFIKDLNYFRDKSYLFKFDQELARTLKIKKTGSKEEQEFKKVGDLWGDASGAVQSINQDEVKSLIRGLSQLRANEFLAPLRTKKDYENEISLMGENDQAVFSITFGALKKHDKYGDVYTARTSLEDESVYIGQASIDALINKELVKKAQ